jgi:hypothetical protein
MNETLVAQYRCPESLVKLSLAGELSAGLGYFSLDNAVCFERSSVGSPAKLAGAGLPELSRKVTWDGPTLRLPFDSSEIVDNLRRERYTANGYPDDRAMLSGEVVRKIYYWIRPLLAVSVRKHFQRLALRNWQRLPFPAWPVDTTVEHIHESLLFLSAKAQKVEFIPFIWFWPQAASSCVIVTHDVETKKGVSLIPRLMGIDEAFGIKASFQLVPRNQYTVGAGLLKTIETRGFEVAIHDLTHDGNLFDDRNEFLSRARSINRHLQEYRAQGFRAGRMYRKADWYEALEISYDMSIPNVAHLDPQRGGCCTVFPYFIGRILELPLTTIQDYSLFHILGDYSIELWKRQIALIMEKHGLVSFLVHPDYVEEERALGVYKALLDYVSRMRGERDVWVALPREVNRWWRERSQMRLVREGGVWRIEGRGHERARIAYAYVESDQLVYTFPATANIQLPQGGLGEEAAMYRM